MNKILFTIICLITVLPPAAFSQTPENLVWQTQSVNAAGSMPLGGGDIGMNVWVEGDDLLFYLCRTGSYDENNALLKQGRFRIRTSPSIFDGDTDFRQELHPNDGYMTISGKGRTHHSLGGRLPSRGACRGERILARHSQC